MIDLHCHTSISDNSLSTVEVISLAKELGITHLAITDHDTTKGLIQAIQIGEDLGVTIIPGIEISAYDYKRNTRAHILGFYIQPGHSALEELCYPIIEARHQASFEMVQRIRAAGYEELTWEQVQNYAQGGTGVYKQHIMHALMDLGYTNSIYGDLYNQLFSKGGGSSTPGIAYIPILYVDVIEAIKAVRMAGGVPVIAHPKQFSNFESIAEWVEVGLEGIEVIHPFHNKDDEELARQIANKFNLVKTGGSDFHGMYGAKEFPLGSKSISIEDLHALQERRDKIHSLS